MTLRAIWLIGAAVLVGTALRADDVEPPTSIPAATCEVTQCTAPAVASYRAVAPKPCCESCSKPCCCPPACATKACCGKSCGKSCGKAKNAKKAWTMFMPVPCCPPMPPEAMMTMSMPMPLPMPGVPAMMPGMCPPTLDVVRRCCATAPCCAGVPCCAASCCGCCTFKVHAEDDQLVVEMTGCCETKMKTTCFDMDCKGCGNVKFTVEDGCVAMESDTMSASAKTVTRQAPGDVVTLEGNVVLKCEKEGNTIELKVDRVTVCPTKGILEVQLAKPGA